MKYVMFRPDEVRELIDLLRDRRGSACERMVTRLKEKIKPYERRYTCESCGKEFVQGNMGRSRITCSNRCRQRKSRGIKNPSQGAEVDRGGGE